MAKMILSMDGLVLKSIELEKERVTIGRKPHNDIQIDNLAVSAEHAVVVTILNDSFLEDLGSTNGTFVNGNAIKKHFLQNNDVVELGKYKLKFLNDKAGQTSNADFEKTMVLRAPSTNSPEVEKSFSETQAGEAHVIPPTASPQMAQSVAATQITPPAVIQVLSGSNAGKQLELTKTLTTLGKPGVQVAVITRRPQGYFLTHVEGVQFPLLNGEVLDAQARLLNDHDVIELSGIKMEFFLKA